jgi:hypothetical protein
VQSISIYSLDGQLYQYSKLVDPKPGASFSKEQLRNFSLTLNSKPFLLLPSNEKTTPISPPEKVVSFVR